MLHNSIVTKKYIIGVGSRRPNCIGKGNEEHRLLSLHNFRKPSKAYRREKCLQYVWHWPQSILTYREIEIPTEPLLHLFSWRLQWINSIWHDGVGQKFWSIEDEIYLIIIWNLLICSGLALSFFEGAMLWEVLGNLQIISLKLKS